MLQRSISRPIETTGIGLHRANHVLLRLEPMPENSGIVFYRSDTGVTIPLSVDMVVDTTLATVIGRDGSSISTIEHFLATLYAYGIDNLKVILDGDEMPVMDGSAFLFCRLLDDAGVVEQSAPKRLLHIKRKVEVRDGDKYAILEPSLESSFHFDIDFSHPAIGKQSFSYISTRDNFIDEVASARTFGFLKDIEYLRSQNLALGATLDNVIGLDEELILNPEGLRFDNEFVRHKLLDAIGDMMLIGYHIVGDYRASASSHRLNHLLTQKLFSDSNNYEIISSQQSEA